MAALVATLKRGSLLAKVDIESAYRLIPVHPQPSRQWSGKGNSSLIPCCHSASGRRPKFLTQWQTGTFIDLAFNSSTITLTTISSSIHHYLDDYIIIAPPHLDQCSRELQLLLSECNRQGIPIAPQKTCGPTTCLTFLGIEINTEVVELRLPDDKLQRLQSILQEWGATRNRRLALAESWSHWWAT